MPTNPELKEMTFEGKAFFRVGCRNCGGGKRFWRLKWNKK